MGRRCKLCSHTKRVEIEAAVVRDNASYRTISKTYGISCDGLKRHIKSGHVYKELQAEHRTEGLIRRQDLTEQLQDLQRLLHKYLRNVQGKDEIRQVTALVKEIKSIIELLGKLLGRFPRETDISIAVNPIWISLKQEIYQALVGFPEARAAMLEAIENGDGSNAVHQQMIRPEGHDPVTPAVLEIINREFEEDHPQDTGPDLRPVEVYDKEKEQPRAEVPAEQLQLGIRFSSRVCYKCVRANSHAGQMWSVGQIWDSDNADGPEPPKGDENWQVINPLVQAPGPPQGLLPTRRV